MKSRQADVYRSPDQPRFSTLWTWVCTKMRQEKYPSDALLIISDGGDNHSRYTEGEIKSTVKEADLLIYAIGNHHRLLRQSREEQLGPALLAEVSEMNRRPYLHASTRTPVPLGRCGHKNRYRATQPICHRIPS